MRGDYVDNLHIANSIGYEIKAVNQLMLRQMMNALGDVDKLTIMHGWIIGYLRRNSDREVFQRDIESNFAISRSTVTNIVKLMEKKGYIKREPVMFDARLKKLTLTKKGVELGISLEKSIRQNEEKFSKLLEPEEKDQFLFLIRKLRKGLESDRIRKEQG